MFFALFALAACGTSSDPIFGEAGPSGASSASSASSSSASASPTASSSSSSSAGGASASSSSASGHGGVGGIAPPECVVASDCPGVDNECRVRSCSAGKCGVDFVPMGTAIAKQTPNDCSTATCDGAGDVSAVYTPNDIDSDGNDCTDDVCSPMGPTHPPKADGEACLSACGCVPCDGAPNGPKCNHGLCKGASCFAYIPVKCLVNGTTYVGCNGFANQGQIITWTVGQNTTSCVGDSAAFCPKDADCFVSINGTGQGFGKCL
jgi:hypothetical protein